MSEVITVSEIGQKKLIEQFPSINNIYDISYATCIAVMSEAGGNYESKQFRVLPACRLTYNQRYTYRMLQTIQIKLILLCVWAMPAVLSSTKTALKFKYEI